MYNWLVSALALVGSLFIFLAGLGFLRLKDPYSQLHAITKATSFGMMALLLATALHFAQWAEVVKALLVLIFIYLTAPLSAHAIAKAVQANRPKDVFEKTLDNK